jgi:site-specific DNA-methyltransferase (adenine-specific)
VVRIKQTIKLYNHNCLDALKKIEDESVDLILTDPPYNLGNFMRGRQTNLKKMRENFFGDAGWDDMDFEEWTDSMHSFFEQAHRVLKKKGSMIMFMSLLRVETMVKIAAEHKFYYKTTGVWHKKNPMPRNMNLHFINSTEGWLYFVIKGRTGTFNNDGKALHDFIETSVAPAGEKRYGGHPTQKPETLFEHFVQVLTNENDVVLDPFMGSGTAGVVAKRNNRNFIGIEINHEYFERATLRMNDIDNNRFELVSIDSQQELM